MVDRRSLTMKDMWGAVAVLAVALVVVLGLMGNIGFGNDTDDGQTPTADVVGGFQRSAAALQLPLAVPRGLPAEWQPNSFYQTDPATTGGTASRIGGGWLTAEGRFVTLIQSTATPDVLAAEVFGGGRTSTAVVQAGGTEWSSYPGAREEVAWVRTAGPVTLLITGSASEADFRILADSIA
ncbi:DUF4245 domain-containing protein [Nakamurella deserti]|uniref:DUF4245 domain-containing protein n=1 Tax=Nakamurella deserti TaxID=2164074 RepID=UPI001300BA2D|nr:DUF4245 domain-containing protein [Nakamurella deserti]